jgi:hypothetical protein
MIFRKSKILLSGLLFVFSSLATAEEFDPCSLLQDQEQRALLGGALELKLMNLCGEISAEEAQESQAKIPGEAQLQAAPSAAAAVGPAADILLNNPALDVGGTTQSETSVAVNGSTVCAAWNDAGEGFGANGFSGFAVSNDGGQTFTDQGPFPNGPGDSNSGDPSLAYSARDNAYYYAALSTLGLSMWVSVDSCQTFTYVGAIHNQVLDDKELIAVDNDPLSPWYGRIHAAWTDFSLAGDRNVASFSDDGGVTWSVPTVLVGTGPSSQGVWPAVAPGGNVYIATLHRFNSDQLIYESTDGGATYTQRTNIATNLPRPENAGATAACGRTALNGNIRNLPSPQIVITPDPAALAGYVIHAIYPYDSGTISDQWFPALGANANGELVASWYDRRLDAANNLNFDRYASMSSDGGLTWQANIRISDVSSQVSTNQPHFDGLAACYHGDYDQVVVDNWRTGHIVWSDDRRVTATGPNPDIYYDTVSFNQAPVANAGPDQTLECTSPVGATAHLDGSASFDPDGDPLTFAWTNSFGTANGEMVDVSLPLGIHLVTLTVEDAHSLTDTDTTSITVEDATPPVIQCNAPATIVPPDAPITFTATSTDACDAASSVVIKSYDCFKFTKKGKRIDKTNSCEVSFADGNITIADSGGVKDNITWEVMASDANGNTATTTCSVLVVKPGKN